MVGTVLIITFLNCFFMFSTTVSTCALWWQNKRYRCRNCGHRHTKNGSVYDNENNETEENSKPDDDEFENYVQCPNPMDNCYGNNEDTSMQNRLNCAREQKGFQQDSEVKGMMQQQEDLVAADGNGPTAQQAVTTPGNINDVHDARKNNSNEYKKAETEDLKMKDTKQPQVPNKNGDSLPTKEIIRQSDHRDSSKHFSSVKVKPTAAMKSSKYPKITQCINNYNNLSTSPDSV